jgi:hypothetical protein
VKGNVLETTLVSEVTGFDMIGGARYARVESRHDGRLWMTEWLRLTPEGLFLGKTNEDGQERLITPPQKTLSPHVSPGETWSWKATEAPVSVQTRVVGKETAEVPAGKFDSTKLLLEVSMVLPEATIHSSMSRWFSPGLGYVLSESATYAGDRFVGSTKLRLVAFDPAQPAPASRAGGGAISAERSASGQKLGPAQVSPPRGEGEADRTGQPVRYVARWDVQNSGVTDKLNSVYFINPLPVGRPGQTTRSSRHPMAEPPGPACWNGRRAGTDFFRLLSPAPPMAGWRATISCCIPPMEGPASPLPDLKHLGEGRAAGAMRLQMGQMGTSATIYTSEDGGTAWRNGAKLPRNDFEHIFAMDPQHIWVAGDYGRYALTTDGGATWSSPALPSKTRLTKVYFISATTGWMLPSDHNGGPLASKDGGLTWTSQYAGAGQNRPLREIHFVNERDGFLLVGSNRPDVVYRTSDGGARWATIGELPDSRTGLSFPTVDNGWVVGPNGYIVHYHLVPVPAAGK